MRVTAVVPAYNAEHTVGGVVRSLSELWPPEMPKPHVIVVDDGSRDGTTEQARSAGAFLVSHDSNRGKGAALLTGLRIARDLGFDCIVSLDADGQHPPDEAVRMARLACDAKAIVLGIRDLRAAGAPRRNRLSNGISNLFLSVFTGRILVDTQCGLRRYPVVETLSLGPRDPGYAFEAEVLLLASRAGVPIIQTPVRVLYDLPIRTSHFRVVRDPARIVARVLRTWAFRSGP